MMHIIYRKVTTYQVRKSADDKLLRLEVLPINCTVSMGQSYDEVVDVTLDNMKWTHQCCLFIHSGLLRVTFLPIENVVTEMVFS